MRRSRLTATPGGDHFRVVLLIAWVISTRVTTVVRAHDDGRSNSNSDSGLTTARDDVWMTTTRSSLLAMTTDAERCRARAWGTVIDAPDGVGACEALMRVSGSSSGMRCAAASASARCRLERAGARARSEACAERGDGCERCVLRALGRTRDAEAGGGDDAGEDEVGFMLDRGIEFAVYSEESAAIDRDCKHYVAVWRAELAANAIAALSTRLADVQKEANERTEAITRALTSLDDDARAQADAMRALRFDVSAAETATREAAATVDALRMRQREFTSDFERFTSSTMDAIVRMERASSGLLAVARFGAATAQSCVRALTYPFTLMRVIQASVLRFAILIIGVYDCRIRVDAATTLAIDWIISTVANVSSAGGLRIAVACAFFARLVRHTTKLPIAFTAASEPKRGRQSRASKSIKRVRSTRAPATATRASARIKSKSATRVEDAT